MSERLTLVAGSPSDVDVEFLKPDASAEDFTGFTTATITIKAGVEADDDELETVDSVDNEANVVTFAAVTVAEPGLYVAQASATLGGVEYLSGIFEVEVERSLE